MTSTSACRVKADEVALAKAAAQPAAQKLLQKKERRAGGGKVDPLQEAVRDPEREAHDSFEKFYNKDLDLEEGKWALSNLLIVWCV